MLAERTLGELNARCVSPTHLVHAHNVCPINTSCVQLTQPAFNLPSQASRAACSARSRTEMVKMACEPPRWLCHLGPSRANLIRAVPSRPIRSQLDPCCAILLAEESPTTARFYEGPSNPRLGLTCKSPHGPTRADKDLKSLVIDRIWDTQRFRLYNKQPNNQHPEKPAAPRLQQTGKQTTTRKTDHPQEHQAPRVGNKQAI